MACNLGTKKSNFGRPPEHTLFLIGKLLYVIRKNKRVSAITHPHILLVEKGGENRKREEMCGGTHKSFLLCFREDRINF